MNAEDVKKQANKLNSRCMAADGLDSAIIGSVTNCDGNVVLAYSVPKAIDVFVNRDGMTYEEAEEWFYYNVADAYVGEGTPVYLHVLDIISPKKPLWKKISDFCLNL